MKKYKIVDSKDDEKFAIEIAHGEFAGVTYNYNTVKIVEDEVNDQAVVQFGFNVESGNDTFEKSDLEKSEQFQETIGNILIEIFEENMKTEHKEEDGVVVKVDDEI